MKKVVTAALAIPLMTGAVLAQEYPERPISMVVGFSPGGGMDTLARLVGDRASQELGQQIAVENRPGAGGTIAAAHVAEAEPDGYTLYLGETTTLMGPVVFDNVGYDPIESFEPVAHLANAPLALVANPDVPVENLEDFLSLVSEKPGEYFYATSGVATVHHLAGEILEEMAGLDMVDVPFQGGSPSVTAVVSGEVPFGFVSLNAATSQAEGGNLKILGVTTADRVPDFPDIPAISEAVEGFSAAPSQFVLAPAGTPADVVQTLSEAFGTAMSDEELLSSLTARGFLPDYQDADTFASDVPDMVSTWSDAASVVSNGN
ncbi:Bug family tripartite tricarboxylate transporter substrate binding protein [Tranquillimonas alkanivorans]|uniref:Tripartite-type tricarboxylate transporter, receptor component TctC n=1 Tax=Tranquillimonas alkanivorans TaxID=441119 RepID=A0A1I5UCF2_9RHOB|nr:tripartite tricarboxylate transporter substrate binding protein [Tranquillimonas alkanivorans]SFP92904.1 Tripartite-type tricarboxylate transporter, receptor component TctC [Tranquillimonas alkanivorans]